MNKSFWTHAVAVCFLALGVWLPADFQYRIIFIQSALFALSGAVTNWLAVYMLFERIPLVYGSGVIPVHFQEFKAGIHQMIIENFFNEEKISQLTGNLSQQFSKEQLIQKINLDDLFDDFVNVICESSLGSLLSLIGGRQALAVLRDPFKREMSKRLDTIVDSLRIEEKIAQVADPKVLLEKIELLIDNRLNELTPEGVKILVEEMIRQHLGWLVVWGGIFGGLLGALSAYIQLVMPI